MQIQFIVRPLTQANPAEILHPNPKNKIQNDHCGPQNSSLGSQIIGTVWLNSIATDRMNGAGVYLEV